MNFSYGQKIPMPVPLTPARIDPFGSIRKVAVIPVKNKKIRRVNISTPYTKGAGEVFSLHFPGVMTPLLIQERPDNRIAD
jgi:hypothetical protein